MRVVLREGKPGQPIGYLRVLGYFLGLCALVATVMTAIDTYQESKHAKWPAVDATITEQIVLKDSGGRHDVWYIQSGLRYMVDGEELTSSIHSRVTSSTAERNMMRKWASQHPPGTSLPVRYDPEHHNAAVLVETDMPEAGPKAADDAKMVLIFVLSSLVFLGIARVLQRRRAWESGE